MRRAVQMPESRMADDLREQVARIEERLEQLAKRSTERDFDARGALTDTARAIEQRIEQGDRRMEERFREVLVTVRDTINGRIRKLEGEQSTMEKMLRELIDARLEVQEARNTVVRWIAFGIAGGVLVAFLNFVVGGWIGTHPVKFPPTAPPYHSTDEPKERSLKR